MNARMFLGSALLVFVLVDAARAAEDPFRSLTIEPPKTEHDICRNGIVAHRIAQWKKPPSLSFGMSVEEIMKDVAAEPIKDLQARGCDPRYLWGFMACTGLDDPNAPPQVIPRGVSASTDAEMADVMRRCIAHIASVGIEPSLRQSHSGDPG